MIEADVTIFGAKDKLIFEGRTDGATLSSALVRVAKAIRRNRRGDTSVNTNIKANDLLMDWRYVVIKVAREPRVKEKVAC